MEPEKETIGTIQGRLNVLKKALLSEENSVQYYNTLIEKTPEDSEENIGTRRMYEDLREEEKSHVKRQEELIDHWESKLKELEGSN